MSKTFDRYASVVFLIIGAAFAFGSFGISKSAYGSSVGPNIFPLGLGILMILLSIRLFFDTLRYKDEKKEKESLDYKRFGIIIGAAFLYVISLETIGYVIGTFLFLLVGFQTMERGKLLRSVIISAIFSLGVYYLFVVLLQGTLPSFPIWFS